MHYETLQPLDNERFTLANNDEGGSGQDQENRTC